MGAVGSVEADAHHGGFRADGLLDCGAGISRRRQGQYGAGAPYVPPLSSADRLDAPAAGRREKFGTVNPHRRGLQGEVAAPPRRIYLQAAALSLDLVAVGVASGAREKYLVGCSLSSFDMHPP